MVPKGRLIIIGGKEDKVHDDLEMEEKNKDFKPNEILKLIVAEKGDRIEVITTATAEPKSTEDTYSEIFKNLGYINFGFLYITNDKKSNPDVLERINNAKTIFFSGGDQCKICNVLKDTAVANLIYEKYQSENQFTVAGTSAGAMCMSEIMIGAAVNGEAMLSHDLDLEKGLGFLNCIVDTHFVHRGRFGRLAHAVVLNPKLLGLGLGEDTALMVENGTNAVCHGSGMVVVINARGVMQTNAKQVESGQPIYAENITVNILTDGCRLNLSDGTFQAK